MKLAPVPVQRKFMITNHSMVFFVSEFVFDISQIEADFLKI